MPPRQRKIAAIVSKLLEWYPKNARDLPWRRSIDPYGVFVSEIMLQQTQVKTVIPYFERWMKRLPDIASLAAADQETIHKLWEGLGYYTRVRNLQRAAQVVVTEHGGHFPEEHEAILALPGIGPYTAGAIASMAFHQPRPILDGNVIRVLTRLFGIAENPREKVTNKKLWSLATELVERSAETTAKPGAIHPISALNQSLMELGALVCTPRQPRCPACPLRAHCDALKTGRVETLPNLGERARATARFFAAVVAECDGRFLVRQRPAGVVNAHLWEFPNVELPARATPEDAQNLARECQSSRTAPHPAQPLATIRHSITRYRITLDVFRALIKTRPSPGNVNRAWLTLSEIKKLAFPSAHRRILRQLENTMT